MFSHLLADIKTVFRHDPAVKSWLEVLICYPGVHALSCYRLAHWLYLRKSNSYYKGLLNWKNELKSWKVKTRLSENIFNK